MIRKTIGSLAIGCLVGLGVAADVNACGGRGQGGPPPGPPSSTGSATAFSQNSASPQTAAIEQQLAYQRQQLMVMQQMLYQQQQLLMAMRAQQMQQVAVAQMERQQQNQADRIARAEARRAARLRRTQERLGDDAETMLASKKGDVVPNPFQ